MTSPNPQGTHVPSAPVTCPPFCVEWTLYTAECGCWEERCGTTAVRAYGLCEVHRE